MREFDIRWRRFRGFRDTGWLHLRPLTIVIGSNNSGKTSLHAPLLLMKQTLRARNSATGLLTRDGYIDAGAFADISFNHQQRRPIELSLRWSRPRKPDDQTKAVGYYAPTQCIFDFALGKDLAEVDLLRYRVLDQFGRHYLTRRRMTNGSYTVVGPAGRFSARTIPAALRDTPGAQAALTAIVDARPDHFLFTGSPILRAAVEAQSTKPETELGVSRFSSLYLAIVERVTARVRTILENLYYVGPLRERPQRFYELSGERPGDVGTRGQSAMELLFRHRGEGEAEDVYAWLKRFGLPSILNFDTFADTGFAVTGARTKGSPTINFADSGFGFSQVLPLIVQGLLGPIDSLLLAEQPEIHLNPQLQATLADLFVAVVKSGRGVMVETHSEHLLLRLRRLVGAGRIRPQQVALYYVEKRGEVSRVRLVPIEEGGYIDPSTWPHGFFGSALRDAAALGRYMSRASEGG